MRIAIVAAFIIVLALVVGATYRAAHSVKIQHSPATSSSFLNVVGDTEHDLGIVNLGDSAIITYTLRNNGDEPVHISGLHPSCGCTAAIVDSDNIKPGGDAHIRAIFNTFGKAEGNFSKNITVVTNSAVKSSFRVGFHGVLKMPAMPHIGQEMHLSGIFQGNCASCHAMRGRGQLGVSLWNDDCALCHTGEANAPPSLDDRKMIEITPSKFERIIANGIQGKNMPAFDNKHQGPLTDQQILSLREFFERRKSNKS
jgi:mono/diheme cytochrome c family protein